MSRDGARIALPITSAGATALLRAFSSAAPAPAAAIPAASQPAFIALGEGAAELIQSTTDGGDGSSGGGSSGGGSGSGSGSSGVGTAPQLQQKTQHKSPAAVIKAAALALLPATSASASAVTNEIPTKVGGAVQVESRLQNASKRLVSTLLPMKWKTGFKVCFQIRLVPLHQVGEARGPGAAPLGLLRLGRGVDARRAPRAVPGGGGGAGRHAPRAAGRGGGLYKLSSFRPIA
jgi:hypothetical protein